MHPAVNFLHHLDARPETTYNIETFTDLPKGAPKLRYDPLCKRWANLTLAGVEEIIPQLETLNDAGAAVYFMVNECAGQRKKEKISRIRGVHADFDGVSEEVIASVRARLQPTIEVQSSDPMNLHMYWLLAEGEELDVETAEAINRQLVELGADKAAVDVSRLLRLPGFRHMKYRNGRPQ
ncbi:MAG: DNA-primase RepB domain-containing protein [Sphingomonadaceae bacterium]|jgi:hypothetical protein